MYLHVEPGWLSEDALYRVCTLACDIFGHRHLRRHAVTPATRHCCVTRKIYFAATFPAR